MASQTEARYFIYEYVTHESGATGSDDTNMNPDGAAAFSYIVPSNTEVSIARLNMSIVDANPTLVKFGGLAELANGVLLEVMDRDGLAILNLTGGRPLTKNSGFLCMSGVDMQIETGAGLDVVKVRFSLFKAGANLKLTAGQKIQFTMQDDLSGLDEFRCMVQGVMST